MDTTASLKELREEDLDTVSGGKTLHFGKLHFGKSVVQTNIAMQVGLAIGGTVIQIIGQSNISDPLRSLTM